MNLSKVFTTSNPSETDSYCSTIIYNSNHTSQKDKRGLKELPENKEIVSYNFEAKRKSTLSSLSVSPDDGATDSDNISSDRVGNISSKKYSSASSYR